MAYAFAEIAFTEAVRDIQNKMGSGAFYEKLLEANPEQAEQLGEGEAAFIAARDGFYQATVSETGWPYVQFRGGPPGFLKVLDGKTVAYADFRGNRQYVSVGNLTGNDRVSLILMDYPNRRRLKFLGRARFDDDEKLINDLHVEGYKAKPERAVVIDVEAFDWNCPAHIPQRLTVQEFEPVLATMRQQILQLQEENKELKEFLK
ncbi:Flavodoxin reductases (ferredoxin-NADPH reductases) family 1 [hydrothermal vent metagenome]|uniref:Flavodoxin reductases (Ferredoxin-NADPH reductases) family 1 n=1 Tax=hydrothermal vent metagenome TaxID=652676 RepID=A0A3B0S8D2_9ZZZZ